MFLIKMAFIEYGLDLTSLMTRWSQKFGRVAASFTRIQLCIVNCCPLCYAIHNSFAASTQSLDDSVIFLHVDAHRIPIGKTCRRVAPRLFKFSSASKDISENEGKNPPRSTILHVALRSGQYSRRVNAVATRRRYFSPRRRRVDFAASLRGAYCNNCVILILNSTIT